MGCDIHLYVERKVDGVWQAAKGTNPYITQYERWADEPSTKDRQYYLDRIAEMDKEVYEGWLYNGRNYNLFAILADVRNRCGIKPISEPRGLPRNLSDVIEKEYGDDYGHSSSYYTFKEILDFDWAGNFIENEAYVDEATYIRFKQTGDPYPCFQDVSGGNTEKVLNSKMDRLIESKYEWEKDKSYYTAIKWKESFQEVGSCLSDAMNKYIQEQKITNLEDVRMVFWFDN